MAQISRNTLFNSTSLLDEYAEVQAHAITENGELIDMFEDRLRAYLTKISESKLTSAESREVSKDTALHRGFGTDWRPCGQHYADCDRSESEKPSFQ